MGDLIGSFCDGCQALVSIGTASHLDSSLQVLCPFTCGHGLCGSCRLCPYKQISLWGCPVCGCKEPSTKEGHHDGEREAKETFGAHPTDSFDLIEDLAEIISTTALQQEEEDLPSVAAVGEREEEVEEAVAWVPCAIFSYTEDDCDLPLSLKEARVPQSGWIASSRQRRSPSRKLECKKLRDTQNQLQRKQVATFRSWEGNRARTVWNWSTLGNSNYSYAGR